MSVRFVNKERFYAKLRAAVPKVEIEITRAAKKTATEMVGLAKSLAPVDEGALQDSIQMYPGPRISAFTVKAGGDVTTVTSASGAYDYALAQEYGTQDMAANPFFWPSYRVVRRTFRGRVGRALRKAIKEAGF